MRLPTLVLIAFVLAACSPMSATDTTAPTLTAAEACAARGGQMMRVGRLQTERCVTPYSDAGRPCRDGDDCMGDCRAPDPGVREGVGVMGVCAPNDLPFGCNTPIENGRAQPTLCVD